MQTPLEFTPEITQDFYNSMARPIIQRGKANVAAARSNAVDRGLTGTPFESSAVQGAQGQADTDLSDFYAKTNYDVAGLKRGERLTQEGQQFQAGESAKNRSFEQSMAAQNYDRQRDMEALQNRRAYQAAPWQIASSAAGTAGGIKLAGAI